MAQSENTITTSGALTSDEQWSGTVVLTGSVSVDPPWQLDIAPGTIVQVPPNESLSINSQANIIGSEDLPIVFEGSGNAPWSGLQFGSSSSSSFISHAVFSGASTCIAISGGVQVIQDSLLNGCIDYGIYIGGGAPEIANNRIVDNPGTGIQLDATGASITYNTIDANGGYGLRFNGGLSDSTIIENNIISRNALTGWYFGAKVSSGYNNVWGNTEDYQSPGTIPESHLSSDPLYLDLSTGNRRLQADSASKTASSEGGEIGAYGDGGTSPDYRPEFTNEATTSGALTRNERWSGTVTLTGSVSVDWPWQLEIAPGTVVQVPASESLLINARLNSIGSADSPIVFEGAGGGLWSGLQFGSSSSSSFISHAVFSGASTCIAISGGVQVIQDSLLNGCIDYGIYIGGGAPEIANNRIVDNPGTGIQLDATGASITYNTIDANGGYGLRFNGGLSDSTIVENNIISRNALTGWYFGAKVSSGYNNVWGNTEDYQSPGTIPESHLSSDPLYLDLSTGNRRLQADSASKTASSEGGEIGAYGDGGTSPDYRPEFTNEATTSGALTRNEHWSGTVTLTGSVSVDWPWQLEIAPGTVVQVPASESLLINARLNSIGSADSPIVFEGAGGGLWSGLQFGSSSGSSFISHAVFSGASTCIAISGGVQVIQDSLLNGCIDYGINIGGGAPEIANNRIVDNPGTGIQLDATGASITYNTIDTNGGYGLRFNGGLSDSTIVENNIISRNALTGWYFGAKVSSGYNNVWGNTEDYQSPGTIPESHLSSDPLYLDLSTGNRRLQADSASKTASSEGGEIGAYGDGGTSSDYRPEFTNEATTSGALTRNEHWSGTVTLTGSVSVDWPWQLEIAPGTVVQVPANESLLVNSRLSSVGSADSPIVFEGAGGALWSGLQFGSSSGGSFISHAVFSGANTCIAISGGKQVIQDSLLNGCIDYGVYIGGGAPEIANNRIVDNPGTGIQLDATGASITYNTIDANGGYGLRFNGGLSDSTIVENNIISRNALTGWYFGAKVSSGYNNVWRNAEDYQSPGTIPESHLSSDPVYVDLSTGNRRIACGSPSKTAGSKGGEIGAYGNGRDVGDAAVICDPIIPLTLRDNVWELIVVPGETGAYSIQDLFEDALPMDTFDSTWTVYTFDNDVQDYRTPDLDYIPSTGEGMWIIQIVADTVEIELPSFVPAALPDGNVACASSVGCIDKRLPTSDQIVTWAMVGSPSRYNVPFSDFRIVSDIDGSVCIDGCTVADAVNDQLTTGFVWAYVSENADYTDLAPTDSVSPWQGVWFNTLPAANAGNMDLLLPLGN
ncbi:right-handed parallel beta-helix repeat-containing protein [Granulosicoccus antarcticus]|uniref:right-handed parallel beta-helix repeat-containing protein n=1 Tax=Granulosicoccus antarcticus TaxID=437505 RepID=UPI00146FB3A0|nr:right-handed parallel beta-helix repeat-containing protein [Granulosicoccus antarcticus]